MRALSCEHVAGNHPFPVTGPTQQELHFYIILVLKDSVPGTVALMDD